MKAEPTYVFPRCLIPHIGASEWKVRFGFCHQLLMKTVKTQREMKQKWKSKAKQQNRF